MKRILAIAGSIVLWALAGAALAQPGTFRQVGDMTAVRIGHTATLLDDGRVLIVGGRGDEWPIPVEVAHAELYDPLTGTFTRTGSMFGGRAFHIAIRLPGGKVLVAGGARWDPEVYDPATGTFHTTGPLQYLDYIIDAALLQDGKVLLLGFDGVHIYDPRTNLIGRAVRYQGTEEFGYTATTLIDGRVLMIGAAPPQLYDPALNAFSVAGIPGDCSAAICGLGVHTVTRLVDGKVLIAGGSNDWEGGVRNGKAQLYDPGLDAFVPLPNLVVARGQHGAVRLNDGRVLLLGGGDDLCDATGCGHRGLASTEIYDPVAGSFESTGNMSFPRRWAQGTVLRSGDVLITGDGRTAEVYQPPAAAPAMRAFAEYHHAERDQFVAVVEQEQAFFESGPAGAGWRRTGERFAVSATERAGWSALCRYFWKPRADAKVPAKRTFSYFFTLDPDECDVVDADGGWDPLGVASYAVIPQDGACTPPLRALWRAYNEGWPSRDPNHRFSTDRKALDDMAARGWRVEGVAVCVM